MEQEKQKRQNEVVWDARIVLTFKKSKVRLNILVCDETQQTAKAKAEEWAKKHFEDNKKLISECIGYDAVMTESPMVKVFRTSYCAFI